MEKENMMPTKRNSSIELLRILCMFFIVFHHFMLNCAFPRYEFDALNGSDQALGVALMLNGFFCVAVNCFVLITGYYGLKFKLRGLLKLYLICAFYSLIGYLVHLYIDGAHIGRSILNYSLFALTNSKWWFVNCYIVLLFSAPLLNVGINALTKSQYINVLALLTVVNVYFGFFGGANGYNQYGYNVQQFVYLYAIGGYISRFVDVNKVRLHGIKYLASFVLCSLLVGLAAIVETFITHGEQKAYYYCNPLIILSALSLFCFMLSYDYYNKIVNALASGALAVYLFQEQVFIGYKWLYPSVSEWLQQWNQSLDKSNLWTSIGSEFGILLLLSLSFVMLLLLFDQLRMLLMRPIWFFYDKKVEPRINGLMERLIRLYKR